MDNIKIEKGLRTAEIRDTETGIQLLLENERKIIAIATGVKKGLETFCVFSGTIEDLEKIIEKSKRYDRLITTDAKEIKKEQLIIREKRKE